LLAEQNIDLGADDLDKAKAIVANERQDKEQKLAEAFKEERDLLFNPIFKNHKKMVQFLKVFYQPNIYQLGDWGVDVVANTRIVYPRRLADRIDSIKAFVTKFNALPPAENPLILYLANNPEIVMPAIVQLEAIKTIHNNFDKNSKNAEEATEERNGLWHPVMAHVRIIADYLKNLFFQNPKKLGRYGFEVNENKRSSVFRTTKIKLGQTVVTKNNTIGGTLINTGKTEVIIYKGKTATGKSVNVLPQNSFNIIKGYSFMTIVNTSFTETAILKIEKNK
jgi:hypothetical protein